jgi:uncharacterized coiled-coil protein SlyX
MSRIIKYEHKIERFQEKIKHSEKKIDELTDQLIQKKISEKKFSNKKDKLSNHIKELNDQIRMLHGFIVKEKRRLEEQKN